MAFALDDIRGVVNAELKNSGVHLTPDDINTYIQNAIRQVDHDRPLTLVSDITGDGTQDYGLPVAFEKGFSFIHPSDGVESPAGQTPPRYKREHDTWIVYEDPTKAPVMRLRFLDHTPITGDIIRVRFTAAYTVSFTAPADGSDLDRTAFLGVTYKALEFAFHAFASRFTQSNDPTILADSVDYAGRGQNFLFLGNEYKTKYKQVIGLNRNVKAAAAFREVDIQWLHGEDMIFHPRKLR